MSVPQLPEDFDPRGTPLELLEPDELAFTLKYIEARYADPGNFSLQKVSLHASSYLRRQKVKDSIDYLKNEVLSEIGDPRRVLDFLYGVMDGEVKDRVIVEGEEIEVTPRVAERLKAADSLMKATGMVRTRQEITGANGAPLTVHHQHHIDLSLMEPEDATAFASIASKYPEMFGLQAPPAQEVIDVGPTPSVRPLPAPARDTETRERTGDEEGSGDSPDLASEPE